MELGLVREPYIRICVMFYFFQRIHAMYGIPTYVYHKKSAVNVGKYTPHLGSKNWGVAVLHKCQRIPFYSC